MPAALLETVKRLVHSIVQQSPQNGIFFPLYADDASEKINLASKCEFPEPSVADTKAYKRVSELPVKIACGVGEKSNQGSANGKRAVPFYGRPSKQFCFEQTTAAQVTSEKNVKDFILTRVGYTRYCFIHNSEFVRHLSEWPS